jgi:glycosyltransferase involved in cell wall biosynthesis
MRLAIVSTHPIQYYSPIFQALTRSRQLEPRVFYTWSQAAQAPIHDPDFGRLITWDIPLLEGYEHEFVPNLARQPGTHHFFGLHTPALNGAVERWRPDAVLVFGWNSRAHLGALRYFKGRVPVFFRGDSTLLTAAPALKTLARRVFLNWIYRHIDVAIAVGSNNRDYFRFSGIPDSRIAFAPHAIDNTRFADEDGRHQAKALEWRQALGIAPDDRVILFAGKLIARKNPVLLLEAFLDSQSQAHLVFLGDGAAEPQLRQLAAGRPRIHFMPFQNQQAMPAVYRLCDLFVLPSYEETWGLAINEAMASGKVVITSDRVGAARDVVKQGVNGWVFESGNREALAAVLRDGSACDAVVLRTMSEAARRESQRWSISEAAAGIERAVLGFRYESATNPPDNGCLQ